MVSSSPVAWGKMLGPFSVGVGARAWQRESKGAMPCGNTWSFVGPAINFVYITCSGKTQFFCIFFRIWIKKKLAHAPPYFYSRPQILVQAHPTRTLTELGRVRYFFSSGWGQVVGLGGPRSSSTHGWWKTGKWRGFRQGDVDVTLVERGAGSWCGSIGRDAAAGREGRHEGWDS